MSALALSPVSPLPFDPFLRTTEGAESVRDVDTLRRGLEAMAQRDVMVATPNGFVGVAICEAPLRFKIERGELASALRVGDSIAITDHRGVQYVGFHAIVVSAEPHADGGATLSVLRPTEAYFYPGRRHVRLDGVLGAQFELDMDGERTVATGLDVSMRGIGIRVAIEDGFVIGQVFMVHLRFSEETISLPARVRTALVEGDEIRLGLEFAGRSEGLEYRVLTALRGMR